ncbi:MAG: hypothetical protein J0L58_16810 [Burkholderiales bacterium]|nr:hypothetical protein [Burkholderiales bacterium]
MDKKTLILLGVVGVGAYLMLNTSRAAGAAPGSRPAIIPAASNSRPPAASIASSAEANLYKSLGGILGTVYRDWRAGAGGGGSASGSGFGAGAFTGGGFGPAQNVIGGAPAFFPGFLPDDGLAANPPIGDPFQFELSSWWGGGS